MLSDMAFQERLGSHRVNQATQTSDKRDLSRFAIFARHGSLPMKCC
jgi:hypothetical protein